MCIWQKIDPRPLLARGLALLAFLFVFALSSAGPLEAKEAEYRLDYGDSITVKVVGQPGLSIEDQPLRPDGLISLPLIQEVSLRGKSIAEVTALLNRAYQPYLTKPQIVVNVAKFRPLRVTLLGQVKTPGTFSFEGPPSLVDAIAAAGGLTDRAARDQVRVLLPDGSTQRHDINRLLDGTAKIPRVPQGSVIEVGETWSPDLYRLLPVIASTVTATAFLMQQWYFY